MPRKQSERHRQDGAEETQAGRGKAGLLHREKASGEMSKVYATQFF